MDKQTYYAILNVSPEASALGIVKAYRQIKLIYQTDSLAAFSLYDKDELEIINQQIEEAYAVLSNSSARLEYDETIKPNETKHTINDKTTSAEKAQSLKVESKEQHPIQPVLTPENISGKILRKIRKQQGLSLNQIAEKTNIPKAYLKALEINDTSILPGRFYLKSYLKQYASSIGLDPTQVWKKYKAQLKD